MKYALNLGEDGRILSAWVVLPNGNYDGMPIVNELPEGNVADYRYVDGEYIYDPLSEPEVPETKPTAQDDTDAMLVDHEYRLTLLELGLTEY